MTLHNCNKRSKITANFEVRTSKMRPYNLVRILGVLLRRRHIN